MTSAFDVLQALEGPAAVIDALGAVTCANAAFARLDAAGMAAALRVDEGWRIAGLADGSRLLTAVDPRVARRGRMLATLSHEIRTPLNGVLGMAGLLAGTGLDATQRAYLAALRDSGEHLLGLVGDVLDYARLDAGRLELEPAPVDPERLLQQVAELLSPRAHAAGLEIAAALDPDAPPPWLVADDGRLRQVLFNLAGNAVKLTRHGGVRLSASAAPAADPARVRVRFTVHDTGPGLAAEAQARVFEEFEQAEAGALAGGAGLGLAIARRIAEAMDGRLGVDSREGAGAAFWLEADLPRADGPPRAAAAALEGATVAIATPSHVLADAADALVRLCGGRLVRDPQAPGVSAVLVDAAGRPPPPPPGPNAFVLLSPEERDRIEPARQAGYAGWLIKPLRRASLAERLGGRAEPRRRSAAADDERAQPPAAARGLRVLLVEDNPVNALLARAMLQREGCQVERAGSGEEALAACDRGGYDLVLMDVRMPGLDGLEATRRLRARGDRTRVAALTANAFAEDRKAALAAGMDDFLVKPLDASALRAVLSRCRANGRAAA